LRRRITSISLLSLILFISVKAQPLTRTFSLRYRSASLWGDGTRGPYRLPDRFLLKGTETITVGGEPRQRDGDYFIDYKQGEIRFFTSIPQGTLIRVEYQRLPLTLKSHYSHRELVRSNHSPPDVRKIIEETDDPPLPSPLSLQVMGSKSLEVTMGTDRDLSFNQSLRLNITGRLTPDVTIIAILTDENLPLQPSGTTQNLGALDRLLIEVQGPIISTSIGDFDLPEGEGRFSSPGRKLQGVRARADLPSGRFLLAGAVSRGKFITNRFQGEEGKQGPYRLFGKEGERDISILAGTERVWLDGIPLRRGEDRDYLIDYQEASLSFTPQRVITFESVIVVEFQYTLRDYQRGFYIGQGNWNLWGEKVRLFSAFIRESDDKEDPQSYLLEQREKEILRRAGDNPDSAWVEGARFQGEGKGDYIQAVDSLGNPYYLYVGADSGSYEVSFSWVGQGKGSYTKSEGGIYRYVYPDGGDYSPKVFLPLPQSHLHTHFGFEAQPDSGIGLCGEFALSKEDGNLFSPYDDGDNLGRALTFSGKVGLSDLALMGHSIPKIGLRGSYEGRQPNFSPIRGEKEKDFRREWGLDPTPEDRLLRTWELSGHLSPLPGLTLSSGGGKLYTKEGLTSLRRRYGGTLQGAKLLSLSYMQQKASIGGPDSLQEGESVRKEGKGSLSLGRASLGLSYLKERGEKGKRDFNAEERRVSLSYQGWGPLSLFSSLAERVVHKPQYVVETPGVSRTWQTQITMEEWRDWQGSLAYSRRRSPGVKNRQDLARLEMGYHREGWEGELHYEANSIYFFNRVKTYLKVAEGEGDYRKEGDEWVPDEDGDYIIVIEETGEARPSSQINGALSFRAEPRPSLRSQTSLRWEEERGDEKGVIPSSGLKGKYGHIYLQEEINLFPYSPRGSLALKYSLSKLKDGRFDEEVEWKFEEEKGISLLYNLTEGIAFRLSLSAGRKRRKEGDLNQYDIRLYEVKVENSLRFNQGLIFSLGGGYERDYNSTSGVTAELFSFFPGISRSFLRRGKAELELGWDRVIQSPPGVSLHWAMVEGRRPGNTLSGSITFSYKLSDLLTAELNYLAKSDPLWGWRQRGRMEVRALF
jgi:hypothetical protein